MASAQVERTRDQADGVVQGGEIEVIKYIESLSHELQNHFFVEADVSRYAQIQGSKRRTHFCIPSREWGPIRSVVPVSFEVISDQQVERAAAIAPENWRQLNLPRRKPDRISHKLVLWSNEERARSARKLL